ncbi:MAG: cysteine desulfurase [Chlamydiales bacterium]|nr:cysteine desulfurase [Chlamydiales bacterium]
MSSAVSELDFPQLANHDLVYLDSAATAMTHQCVIDAMNAYYAKGRGTVNRAVYELAQRATEKYQGAREIVQQFLRSKSPDEIVFTKGTTEAINLVAHSTAFEQGDEILISQMEHHSNIIPWQMVAARTGAALKMIPVTQEGDLDLEAYAKLLSPKTKIVSIAHMTNVTGTIYPVDKMIEMAHDKGALVFIDGAQAAPHLKIDVQELDVDFYAFSGHKVYGPTGIGVLYGKYKHLERLKPYQGGSDMIDEVTFEMSTYQKPPLKFEAGTPNIAAVIGLGAALSFLMGRDHRECLTEYALDQLRAVSNVRILGNPVNRGPLISFVVEGAHCLDIATMLDLKGICVRSGHLCAQPTMKLFGVREALRISLGIYTTKSDIDRFITELNKIKASL